MNVLKPLHGRGLRWKLTDLRQRILPPNPYKGRSLDIFWMSTGRCGTHFVHRLLELATNLTAIHELGIILEDVFRASAIWDEDPERFWSLRLESFRAPMLKIRRLSVLKSQVMTELGHAIYPFGYMLHDYYNIRKIPGRRVKLIHLIREPVASCRSNLKIERTEHGDNFFRRSPAFVTGASSAEKAASIWNKINTLSGDIVARINDENIARTIRIEDLDQEGIAALYEFMEIDGYDPHTIDNLLSSRSQKIRFSHLARPEVNTPDCTEEELETIRRDTKKVADRFGYFA